MKKNTIEKNIEHELGYRPLVLVVDDDLDLCNLLKEFLQQHYFVCYTALSTKQAKNLLLKYNFSAVVLDVQMKEQTGDEWLKELRESGNDIPIIMLTAMGRDAENRVMGLSLGADDYLGKPFKPEELVLRLGNIIRRHRKTLMAKKYTIKFGRGVFDMTNKHLTVDGHRVFFTSAEERLFCYLLERAERAVSREELNASQVISGGERTIDVHIARIRQKIGDDKDRPEYLVTIRNRGYEMRLDHE
ncbi:MAG: response regulator transcription factor [Alphaproteobacteria bacterium]